MLRSEAKRALSVVADFFSEIAEAQAEARFAEDGEFTDPQAFADATLNNLPAIAYALNSGMPVIGWEPAGKNPDTVERVLRAMRQWSEQARALLMQLAAGQIDIGQFYESLINLYVKHATNAYVAGRRAVGNLEPVTDVDLALLDTEMSDDVTRLAQTQSDTEAASGGLGSFLMSMILDPTNFFGSGLPGDPFSPHRAEGLAGGAFAAKGLNAFGSRIDSYANSIRSYANFGELQGLGSMIPPEGTMVWWELGAADHCIDCIAMSDMSPFYASVLMGPLSSIYPGSGHTRCGKNCRCTLQYELPSQVCADPFSGAGLADFGIGDIGGDFDLMEANAEALASVPLLESTAGSGRVNVYVQEAAACAMPMDINSLNRDGDYTVVSDEDAFNWDSDLGAMMHGGLDTSFAWADVAAGRAIRNITKDDLEALRRIFGMVDNAVPGGLTSSRVLRYEGAGSVYHAIYTETGDAIRFEVGATTKGLTVLDPEFTMRAISDLSEHAASKGMRLEINGATAGPGMTRWLDNIGAEHMTTNAGPVLVLPAFPVVKPKQTTLWDLGPIEFDTDDAAIDWAHRTWPTTAEDRWPKPAELGLTDDEEYAISKYAAGGYADLNASLRSPSWVPDPDELLDLDMTEAEYRAMLTERTKIIDTVMARTPVPDDVVVWRGIGPEVLGPDPSAAVGRVLTEKAYMSTSVGPMPKLDRLIVGEQKDVYLRIAVPEGTPGYFSRNLSAYKEENELLLGRGLQYRITGATRRDDGKWIVDAVIEQPGALTPTSPIRLRGIAPDVPTFKWPSAKNTFESTKSAVERLAAEQGDLAARLTAEQREAIRRWTHTMRPRPQDVDEIRAMLEASPPTTQDMIVYRGLKNRHRYKIGDTMTHSEMTSSSVNVKAALGFTTTEPKATANTKRGVLIRIHRPPQSRGLLIDELSELKLEDEYLLPAGETFRVVAVHEDVVIPGTLGKVRVVDMETETALRGIAPELDPVAQTLDGFRDSYVAAGMDRSTEFGQIIDARTGEVLVDRAGRGYSFDEQMESGIGAAVEFTPDDLLLAKGNIVTHVHPYDFSLSTGDILTAIREDVTEVRAESPGFRFILRPNPERGWLPEGVGRGDLGAFKIRMDREFDELFDIEMARPRTPEFEALTFDERLAVQQRAATRALADRYGWKYTELDVGPHVPASLKPDAVRPAIPSVSVHRGIAPQTFTPGMIPVNTREEFDALLASIPAADRERLWNFGVRIERVPHDYPVTGAEHLTAYYPDRRIIRIEDGAEAALPHEAGHALDHSLGWMSQTDAYHSVAVAHAPKGYGDAEVWASSYGAQHGAGDPLWLAKDSPLRNLADNARTTVEDLGLKGAPPPDLAVTHFRAITPKTAVSKTEALPAWPRMSILKSDTPTAVKQIGGVEAKRVFTDPTGYRWLAKTRDEAVDVETAAAQLGKALGLQMPPVTVVTHDGVRMSLQPMVPGEDLLHRVGGATAGLKGAPPPLALSLPAASSLTDAQMSELARGSVLDFLLANRDSHAGNWIVDEAGDLWGIDKGLSVRGIVATSSNPRMFWESAQGTVFNAAIEHADATGFFLKTTPADIGDVLSRLDTLDQKALAELFQVPGSPKGSALNWVREPFGNYVSRLKALQTRKDSARAGYENLMRTMIDATSPKNVNPAWRAWYDAGGSFVAKAPDVPVPLMGLRDIPSVSMPASGRAMPLPEALRTTPANPSVVGNNRAVWQDDFIPATAPSEALTRLRATMGNLTDTSAMNGFNLDQLNAILARAEYLKGQGVDTGLLRALSDYSTVPVSEHGFSIGLTLDDRISLKADNVWKFNPMATSHPTAYDDIGGLFAHEYGHVVFHNLSASTQGRFIELYKTYRATAADDVSTYAKQSLDEWFGEVFAKITTPGYRPGTLKYDDEVWALLAADGRVRTLHAAEALPTIDAVPDLPTSIAKGPYASSSEMVPTATLRRYADIDLSTKPENVVNAMRDEIATHGIRHPVVLEYSPTEGKVLVTDGALKIAVARELGVKYVPARMVRRGGTFPAGVTARARKVPKPTFPGDHVPLNIRPSQVLPANEQQVGGVINDLVVAPQRPPLRMPDTPPFAVPESAVLEVKPLAPGKKMGGMSSKQIYVDPTGKEWLVKPKKVFVDDVDLSRQAIDLEAAVSPLAERVGVNVSPVVSTTIEYPWVPGDPLKTVGASIQPITPGINHMPVVPVPEGAELPVGKFAPGSSSTPIPGNVAWDELSDANLNDLAQNQMFDWFVGNDDGHIGQFLLDSNGKILGIDKDAAFWELPSQYAQGDAIPEYGKHIVHTWWQDMTPERLARIDPKSVEQVLDRIDAISDAEYAAYIEPHLDVLLAHPNGVKLTRDQWRDAILTRKRNMRADFTAYYQRQLAAVQDAGVKLPEKWSRVLKDGFREAQPHYRPLANPATAQNLRDAEARWLAVRNTVQDVLDGKIDVSIGWTVDDFNKANAAGLKYRKIGGFRFHASSEGALDRIAAYLAEPGHSSFDDGFWRAMGYSDEQIEIRNTLQRLMRPVENPLAGSAGPAKWGFIEKPVGDPLGPPKPAPKQPFFKPADHQIYTLPGSSIPINAPRVEWSGAVPEEPPLPVTKVAPETLAAARTAANDAYIEVDDVLAGRANIAFSWNAGDTAAAEKAGLHTEKIGDSYFVARAPSDLDPIRAYLAVPEHNVYDDEFWHLLGYSDDDLAAIDTYEDLKKVGTKRLSAGVMIVEPDGRMWYLAPRNEWAGYQNTVFKGGLEPGETTAAAAAVREVREETGFSVELDSFLGDYENSDRTGITRMYIGHRTGGGPLWAKQKETYEVRLMSHDEAKQALTRHHKPDARDQKILSDAASALEGNPGLVNYVIPPEDAAALADATRPVSLTTKHQAIAPSPARHAINPDPMADIPVSTIFAYDHKVVDDYASKWTETPASDHFPMNGTRITTNAGEKAVMYWKEETTTAGPGLFWANAKKQVLDPKDRFAVHVAQIVRLSEYIDHAPTMLKTIRVNEALLDQVPQLRELLVAAGGQKVNKVMQIGRDEFMALADSIRNNTPLPQLVAHIPTAPMSPVAKVVTIADVGLTQVSDLMSSTTHDLFGTTTFHNYTVAGAKHSLATRVDIGAAEPTLVLDGALDGLTDEQARAAVLAHLTYARRILDEYPMVDVVLFDKMYETPVMRSLLEELGASPTGPDGALRMTRAQITTVHDKVAGDLYDAGADLASIDAAYIAPPPVIPSVPASTHAAEFGYDADHVAAATVTQMTPVAGDGQQVVFDGGTGVQGHSMTYNRVADGKNLRWSAIQLPPGVTSSERRTMVITDLLQVADEVALDPKIAMIEFGSQVYPMFDASLKQMLVEAGATGFLIDREALLTLRDTIRNGIPTSIPYLAPGPLAVALDYLPSSLPAATVETGTVLNVISPGYVAVLDRMGPTLRWSQSLGAPAADALKRAELANLLALADHFAAHPELTNLRIGDTVLSGDVRAAILNRGGKVYAHDLVLDRDALDELAQAINEMPPPSVAATVAGSPMTPVAHPAIDAADAPAVVDALPSADEKVILDGHSMTRTDYGDHGAVTWWRIGNDLEVAAASSLDDSAFAAHVVRLAKVMDENPKIKLVRWRTGALSDTHDSLLGASGGVYYNSGAGIKVTRQGISDLRDQILHETKSAVATVTPTGEPLVGPSFGFDGGKAATLDVQQIAQPKGYEKNVYTVAGSAESVTVRTGHLKTELVWDRIFGTEALKPEAAVRQIDYLGELLEHDAALQRIRFERLDQIPTSTLDMIKAFGGEQVGNVVYLGREEALTLRTALQADLGSAVVNTAVDAVPVAPAVSDVQGIIDAVGGFNPDLIVEPTTDFLPGPSGMSMATWDDKFKAVGGTSLLPSGKSVWRWEGTTIEPGPMSAAELANWHLMELDHTMVIPIDYPDTYAGVVIREQALAAAPALRDALLKAGAELDGEYLQINAALAQSIHEAIAQNTPIKALPGALGESFVPPSAGKTLSAQMGYSKADFDADATVMDWVPVDEDGLPGNITSAKTGLWEVSYGQAYDLTGQPTLLWISKPGAMTFDAKQDAAQLHVLATLDSHWDEMVPPTMGTPSGVGFNEMDLTPQMSDLLKTYQATFESGYVVLPKSNLHMLALGVDNDSGFRSPLKGSAATVVPLTSAKPDIVPSFGFAYADFNVAAYINKHIALDQPWDALGHNATEYAGGVLRSEWERTEHEMIWHDITQVMFATGEQKRQVALAEMYRFAKNIGEDIDAKMEGLLVDVPVLHKHPGMEGLLTGYGGKVQQSGAVVIKKADLKMLAEAMDDQLGLAPLSGLAGAQMTPAAMHGYVYEKMSSYLTTTDALPLTTSPGVLVLGSGSMGPGTYKATYALDDVTAQMTWQFDPDDGDVVWHSFSAMNPTTMDPVSSAQAKAAQSMLMYKLMQYGVGHDGGLVLTKELLDANPGLRDFAAFLGAQPMGGGAFRFNSYDLGIISTSIFDNTSVVSMAAGVLPPPPVVIPVAAVAPIDKLYVANTILNDTIFNDLSYEDAVTKLAQAGLEHPGLPPEWVNTDWAADDLLQVFADPDEVKYAYDAGWIPKHLADKAMAEMEFPPFPEEYLPSWTKGIDPVHNPSLKPEDYTSAVPGTVPRSTPVPLASKYTGWDSSVTDNVEAIYQSPVNDWLKDIYGRYTVAGSGALSTKRITIRGKNYAQRVAVTSPDGIPYSAAHPGIAKKKWVMPTAPDLPPDFVAAAVWTEFNRLVNAAAADGKALWIHSDALRLSPGVSKAMKEAGAKAKSLTSLGGAGYEVKKADMQKLKDLLANDLVPGPTPATSGVAAGISPAVVNAPPPIAPAPTIIPPPPVPVATTLDNAYGYSFATFDQMTMPSGATKTVVGNTSTLQFNTGEKVTYAYEKMTATSRVIRIKKVENAVGSDKPSAILAALTMLNEEAIYQPDVIAVLVNKDLLDNTLLPKMFTDAGWKDTGKAFRVLDEDLMGFNTSVVSNKAPWMPESAIPQQVAGAPTPTPTVGNAAAAVPPPAVEPEPPPVPAAPPLPAQEAPKVAAPSFIYGYNAGEVNSKYATLVDTERVDTALQTGAVGHLLTDPTTGIEGHWSVSPSGKAIGWTQLLVPPTATVEQKRDAAYAMLRKLADEAQAREKVFIQPAVYDQVPGLRQMFLDAGGKEADYPKLGTAVELDAANVTNVLQALQTDTMGGLKVSIKGASDYLVYEKSTLDAVMASSPAMPSGTRHVWKVGNEKPEARIKVTGTEARWSGLVGGGPASKPVAALSELAWLNDQGITNLIIEPAVIHEVPRLDKFLLASGAKIVDGNVVLDAAALNTVRKYALRDALPELLGGKRLAYSITDELATTAHAIVEGAHTELQAAVGAAKQSSFSIGGKVTNTLWSRSESNIYWTSITRDSTTSIGQMRASAGAQLRSFLNEFAQHGSLQTLDIDADVIAAMPVLRDILRKYGAREVPATTSAHAFLTLERSKALKMRAEIEKELGQTASGGAAGMSYIATHNMQVLWPVVEDLSPAVSAQARRAVAEGQTRKAIFVDKDGNEWLFKPGASGRGAVTDRAVAQLAEMLGLNVPPVRIYTLPYEGRMVQGSLQKMVPAKGMRDAGIASPAKLSPAQTEEMLRHSVLDWVVNNDDAHVGNWLLDDTGRMWSIDKSRSWVSFGGAHDVLDTLSNGQGGPGLPPWLFKFWREVRDDPALLQKIHPQSIAAPLRALRNMPNDEYRRLIDPVARALSADRSHKYFGKYERLVEDMVRRKEAAAADFERYFTSEVKALADAGKPIPADWKAWLDGGSHINLDQTPRDIYMERLAALRAKFGGSDTATANISRIQSLMDETKYRPLAGKIRSYFGGKGGSSHWTPQNIVPSVEAAGLADMVQEWRELNEWAILEIVTSPKRGTVHMAGEAASGDNMDILRSFWNPDTGKLRVIRSTNRFHTSDPKAYIPGYQRIGGIRSTWGVSVGQHVVIDAHGGVFLYMDVDPSQVLSIFALGFNPGEREMLIEHTRLDQIVHIRKQTDRMNMADLMTYQGPVDTK